MSKLFLSKYIGAGNDFLLIDDRALFFDPLHVPFLCDRKSGVGADGVILLQNSSVADFSMRIFNCDGSEPAMCGNGLRCFARFLTDLGYPQKPYRIQTAKQILDIDFSKENIRTRLSFSIQENLINTGVPHAVFFVSDLKELSLEEKARPLRNQLDANINFAQIQKDGSIAARTYERGLEAESFACGTGAAAIAISSKLPSPVTVHFSGGSLQIQVEKDAAWVEGNADKLFSAEISYLKESRILNREKKDFLQ